MENKSYFIENDLAFVEEELQLNLLDDYLNQDAIGYNSDNTESLLNYIKQNFRKNHCVDNSMDFVQHEKEIIRFFSSKFRQEIVRHQNQKAYEFYDLFCGAGGLSLGLEKSNLVPVLALDKDKSSLQTYQFNRPFLRDSQLIHDDIKDVAENYSFDNVPLIVGGPPCQGFSNANKQKKENDERNQLYKFYIHTVERVKPDIFLMENVDGMLEFIEQITSDFEQINYSIYPQVLNTKDFGFPQSRKRVFILGISHQLSKVSDSLKMIFDNTIKSYKAQTPFTLWDAISDLPILEAKTQRNATNLESEKWGYTFGKFQQSNTQFTKMLNESSINLIPILNHKSKFNNPRDIEIYRLLKHGEKSDADSIAEINPYANRGAIFKDKFFKLRPNEVCKTITAHMYYDCHMYIHPYASRGLTPREAARIQGFDDDYLFLGTPNEWYRQIGNAVSPLLAKIIGKALNNVLDRIYEV